MKYAQKKDTAYCRRTQYQKSIRKRRAPRNRYKDLSKRILTTRDVDKRDGFPRALLTAKYVIVASPIQYHVSPRDQRVVGIPEQLILDGRNIGASFVKLLYQFNLD